MQEIQDSDFNFEPQREWPFKDMAVGEVVTLELSNEARRYAHNYGASVGKKFVTRSNGGVLAVKRVK